MSIANQLQEYVDDLVSYIYDMELELQTLRNDKSLLDNKELNIFNNRLKEENSELLSELAQIETKVVKNIVNAKELGFINGDISTLINSFYETE